MTPGPIRQAIVSDRLRWVERMLAEIEVLPLSDQSLFFSDFRNQATAESCLRRAIEALCDIGRHILAKGFAFAVTEYKVTARELGARGVLTRDEAQLLSKLAGYRNRLVHFYHEVGDEELYNICANELADLTKIADAYRRWLHSHPEMLDETL